MTLRLYLVPGNKLETYVFVESPYIPTVKVKLFLEFLEFLNQYSFKSEFTLTNDKNDIKIIKQTIIVKNPPSVERFLKSLGQVKIFLDNVYVGAEKLPAAEFVDSTENANDYLGIRIILDRPRFWVKYRTREKSGF